MPTRSTHQSSGMLIGGIAAAHSARRQSQYNLWLEAVGGVVAGGIAAFGPDAIDPPFAPHHRSVGHAVVPTSIAVWLSCRQAVCLQRAFRDAADWHSCSRHLTVGDPLRQAAYFGGEVLCRLLAGAVVGFPAGYLSHLALDACTPSSLPLFT